MSSRQSSDGGVSGSSDWPCLGRTHLADPFTCLGGLRCGMVAKKGGTLVRMIFLMTVCACLIGACGHAPMSSSTASTSSAAAPQAQTSVSASVSAAVPQVSVSASAVAAPGCGTYCQQAGLAQGGPPPCPTAGCPKCPPQNCLTLESSGGTVTNGVVVVKLSCNLSVACHGAVILCLPRYTCTGGEQTVNGSGGRLAGSDLLIPPGTSSEAGVALTALGKQVVSGPGGFRAQVLAELIGYGLVAVSSGPSVGNFSLTSADPPAYPAGAAASCGGVVFVGPDTSCPFAKIVEQKYSNAYSKTGFPPTTVSATSPVTGGAYEMRCTGYSPVACRGGTNALVVFYSS